jgi:small subunit ribosomal protein S29
MLLLQSAAYARESGWVVLYIPRGTSFSSDEGTELIIASEWIESKTEYAYNSNTKLFNQPALASSILSSLLATNPTTLKSIKSKSQIGKYKSNTSLAEICERAKSPDTVEALEGVLATLAEQTEFPVLIAIDEVQALFSTSGLRTPDYKVLESYHLSTPNLFLNYLTGKKTLVCPPPPPSLLNIISILY